jgi:hypothetical protein
VRRPILLLAAVVLLSARLLHGQTTTTYPYEGVTKIDSVVTSPREDSIHVVEINLAAPGIHFELSPATPPNPPQSGDVTTVQKTLSYMSSVGAQFAINTEFFVNPPDANNATPLWGFAASDGNVYSPFQATNENMYAIVPKAPAINIDASNIASVVTANPSDPSGKTVAQPVSVYNAVAGSAQIITNGAISIPTYTENGGVLTDGSSYTGSNSWYANGHLAARSAIGLSKDGKTLYLFTVDDNTADGSLGMTVTEVANYLQQNYGVYNALNLDGGGSSTLSWMNPATHSASDINLTCNVAGNTLYDGTNDRAVGASLAVFASAAPEPGTLILCFAAAGAGIACVVSRRRRTRQAPEITQDIRSQP